MKRSLFFFTVFLPFILTAQSGRQDTAKHEVCGRVISSGRIIGGVNHEESEYSSQHIYTGMAEFTILILRIDKDIKLYERIKTDGYGFFSVWLPDGTYGIWNGNDSIDLKHITNYCPLSRATMSSTDMWELNIQCPFTVTGKDIPNVELKHTYEGYAPSMPR